MRHYDKKNGQWIETDYPKVGGRLRIAHDQNDSISITTEIIKYDGQVAVVIASCTTDKGCYSGIGMASVERDAKIASAILELAETRAIARALRFSGIGVEYCSAEEISHLEQTHSSTPAGKIAEYLADYLRSTEPKQEWLFPSTLSKCGHIKWPEKAFRDVVKAAGLDPKQVTPHTLRHTAITHLVQAGCRSADRTKDFRA